MAALSQVLGWPLMGWQRHVADVALEVDPATGLLAYGSVALTVPRQSGKTTLDGAVMEHRALSRPRARVWYTAQTRQDATDWFVNEHAPAVELSPLARWVKVRRSQGSEGLTWPNGSLLRVFAPQPHALHSKQSDLVVVDEAWAQPAERGAQLDQAIIPTQATRPGAQVWKVSTAGDDASLWMWRTVQAGRAAVKADTGTGLAYFEWSCPEDLDPAAPSSWPQFHPAFGITIGVAQMHAARVELGERGFARAYGNQWPAMASAAPKIPPGPWAAVQSAARDVAPPGCPVGLGFDVESDRSQATVCVAWRVRGELRLAIADTRPGSGWLADRLRDLCATWGPVGVGYQASGPGTDVADVAATTGLAVVPLNGTHYAAGCAGLLEDVTARRVKIQAHPVLAAAADGAVARESAEGGWTWSRARSAAPVSPLVAATCARWALDHPAAQPVPAWAGY